MTSHELAKLLLCMPDLPVATHADNHTYAVAADAQSHGPLKIGRLVHWAGDHLIIGNISKRNLSGPNYFVSEMYEGDAPWEWWRPGRPLNETPAMVAEAKRVADKWEQQMRKARP